MVVSCIEACPVQAEHCPDDLIEEWLWCPAHAEHGPDDLIEQGLWCPVQAEDGPDDRIEEEFGVLSECTRLPQGYDVRDNIILRSIISYSHF